MEPIRKAPVTAAPRPMPTFAPVERPPLLLGMEAEFVDGLGGITVAAACVAEDEDA